MKNRYIGENVRLIADIIDYTKTKEIQGVALFLDFKKAFDSIEWDYLSTVLDVFNFKEDFKRWVHIKLFPLCDEHLFFPVPGGRGR